jgi:hypothetical protein
MSDESKEKILKDYGKEMLTSASRGSYGSVRDFKAIQRVFGDDVYDYLDAKTIASFTEPFPYTRKDKNAWSILAKKSGVEKRDVVLAQLRQQPSRLWKMYLDDFYFKHIQKLEQDKKFVNAVGAIFVKPETLRHYTQTYGSIQGDKETLEWFVDNILSDARKKNLANNIKKWYTKIKRGGVDQYERHKLPSLTVMKTLWKLLHGDTKELVGAVKKAKVNLQDLAKKKIKSPYKFSTSKPKGMTADWRSNRGKDTLMTFVSSYDKWPKKFSLDALKKTHFIYPATTGYLMVIHHHGKPWLIKVPYRKTPTTIMGDIENMKIYNLEKVKPTTKALEKDFELIKDFYNKKYSGIEADKPSTFTEWVEQQTPLAEGRGIKVFHLDEGWGWEDVWEDMMSDKSIRRLRRDVVRLLRDGTPISLIEDNLDHLIARASTRLTTEEKVVFLKWIEKHKDRLVPELGLDAYNRNRREVKF